MNGATQETFHELYLAQFSSEHKTMHLHFRFSSKRAETIPAEPITTNPTQTIKKAFFSERIGENLKYDALFYGRRKLDQV